MLLEIWTLFRGAEKFVKKKWGKCHYLSLCFKCICIQSIHIMIKIHVLYDGVTVSVCIANTRKVYNCQPQDGALLNFTPPRLVCSIFICTHSPLRPACNILSEDSAKNSCTRNATLINNLQINWFNKLFCQSAWWGKYLHVKAMCAFGAFIYNMVCALILFI